MCDGGTQCELCGVHTTSAKLTRDGHPEGPNLVVCKDCDELTADDSQIHE